MKTWIWALALSGLVGLAGCEQTVEDEMQDVQDARQEAAEDIQEEQQDVEQARQDAAETIQEEQQDVDQAVQEGEANVIEEQQDVDQAELDEAQDRDLQLNDTTPATP